MNHKHRNTPHALLARPVNSNIDSRLAYALRKFLEAAGIEPVRDFPLGA